MDTTCVLSKLNESQSCPRNTDRTIPVGELKLRKDGLSEAPTTGIPQLHMTQNDMIFPKEDILARVKEEQNTASHTTAKHSPIMPRRVTIHPQGQSIMMNDV